MELDYPPTKDEVAGVIAQLQCGKSAGPDGIPPEVFKAGSQPLIQKFTEFLCMCWEDGCLPQDLKYARIVHLYKGKGDSPAATTIVPHTGPFRRNLRARSPQGATNVRPTRGHLPEEALHFCWVTSVVFSGAFL
ncbi:hypothetical protein ACOMHN_046693 [Nucella lapillus]